jgi:hypothetical protein
MPASQSTLGARRHGALGRTGGAASRGVTGLGTRPNVAGLVNFIWRYCRCPRVFDGQVETSAVCPFLGAKRTVLSRGVRVSSLPVP